MNVTVILPVHEFDEKVEALLDNAIKSVEKQTGVVDLPEILLVYAHRIENEILNYLSKRVFNERLTIRSVGNENKTDFQSQINFGVENVNTDYFSILEYDDEYSTTYFKNALRYASFYPKTDIFLSLLVETDDNNQAVKLTNETVWAQQFVGENGEIGFLNINILNQYTDFKLCGSLIKKSEYKNIGGLKSNIKLAFNFEFLLRALNNASKVFSMPKIGYKHLTVREGSLFDDYLKNMSMAERKFWFETAKKEANFLTDRVIDTTSLNKTV
jgi:hypothetical protein